MRFGIFGRIEKREKRRFKSGETGYSENLSFRIGGADKTKGEEISSPLCRKRRGYRPVFALRPPVNGVLPLVRVDVLCFEAERFFCFATLFRCEALF